MSDQCVGEIRMFAGNYAPDGWAFCNGALLSVADNPELFALLGATYGGNGQTTFGLPDLRGRLPLGTGASIVGTNFALGASGGAETVALTSMTMPAHSHPVMATAAPATSSNPAGNLMAKSVNSNGGAYQDIMYLQVGAPVLKAYPLPESAVTVTGNSGSHANVMPCTGINFIIALTGFFPSLS